MTNSACFSYPGDMSPGAGPGVRRMGWLNCFSYPAEVPRRMPAGPCFSYPPDVPRRMPVWACFSYALDVAPGTGNDNDAQSAPSGLRRMPYSTCFRY